MIQGQQITPTNSAFSTGNDSQAVLGSGFVIQYGSVMYIVTNFHVVQGMVNMTVTFSDGNTYNAAAKATDPYADVALVTASAPANEFHPLQLTSSSSLQIGDPVAAIGNPYPDQQPD
jgi:S1-C subfamily serine protease